MTARFPMAACLPCLFTEADESLECPILPADIQTAKRIMMVLDRAEKPGKEMETQVHDLIHTTGWTESLATALLNGIVRAVQEGKIIAGALGDAFRRAEKAAVDFAREHPAYATLIAIGIMAVLLPWALEALGFGELGPVAGSFAARWQALYRGYVSRGSLFSFLQRLGMVWRHAVYGAMVYPAAK